MAAKKRSKKAIRELVEETRARHAVREGATIAEYAAASMALLAEYEAEGFGAALAKDQPLSAWRAEHGPLAIPAGAPWSDDDLGALEKTIAAKVPPSLARLLRQGGLWSFRRNPEGIRIWSLDEMTRERARIEGLLDRPAPEGSILEAPSTAWRYGHSGVLAEELRRGANLLPLAPYYSADYGAHFVALHLRDERGECPVLIGCHERGDVTVWAQDVDAWVARHMRQTLTEIDWSFTA